MIKFLKTIYKICLLLCFFSAHILEATWSSPVSISSISAYLSIGMDPSGNATVVWNESRGTAANNVFFNYIPKGGEWHVALPISSTEGRDIFSSPHIAIDGNSNALVLWEEFDDKGGIKTSEIKASMHPSSNEWYKWSSPVVISKTKGAGRFPQLAMNSSGYAVAAWKKWEQENDSPRIIQAATLQFGRDWSAPVDIATGEAVQIRVDHAGNAVAVWVDNNIIKSANLPYGGVWSSPTTVSTGWEVVLAMNSSGYAVVVWKERNEEGITIKSSTMQFGETWSTPAEVARMNFNTTSEIRVAIGHAGNATLVWQQVTYDDSPFPQISDSFIQSAFLPFGGQWTKPIRISPKDKFSYAPQVALDRAGTAFAVWSNNTAIQAATRPFGGTWSDPADLTLEGFYGGLQIAVDPVGYAVITWMNRSGAIQAATWTP